MILKPAFILFESFSENVMQNLLKSEPKLVSIFQKRKSFFMIAAAILIFAMLVPILYNTTDTTELDTATLENYLSIQSNINQYDLMSALDFEDINNINTTAVLEDKTIEDMLASNPDLEQLLNE